MKCLVIKIFVNIFVIADVYIAGFKFSSNENSPDFYDVDDLNQNIHMNGSFFKTIEPVAIKLERKKRSVISHSSIRLTISTSQRFKN